MYNKSKLKPIAIPTLPQAREEGLCNSTGVCTGNSPPPSGGVAPFGGQSPLTPPKGGGLQRAGVGLLFLFSLLGGIHPVRYSKYLIRRIFDFRFAFSFKIFLIFILSNGVKPGFCQGIYNNGATIVIPTGITLYIDGDANGNYLNEVSGGDGEVDIDGEMIVEGDWTNNASNNVFINPDNDGTVELKGTTTQTIGGTGTTVFENLTINNTAAGTAVSLSLNTTVGSILTLTDGIVITGTDTLIMESPTAADLLPATPTNASFVNGNLKRKISGSQIYVFPLGNGTSATNYKRMDFITEVLDLVGATDYITAKIFTVTEACPGPVCDDSVNTSEDGTPVTSVYGESAIWSIATSGVYSSGSYGVNLYVANTGLSAADDDMFTVVKSDDGLLASTNYANWKTFDAATTIPLPGFPGRIYSGGTGFAQKTGFISFSEFAISKSSNIPLPIELLYFSAYCDDDVVLQWTTASETNNDYFTVEKSKNPQHLEWETITTIPGAGNSSMILNYEYTDNALSETKAYYRLRQTDYDGKFKNSDIIVVECGYMYEDKVDIFSYDFKNILIKVRTGREKNYYITLYDLIGRKILDDVMEARKGENVYILNPGKLATGIYLITLENQEEYISEKVMLFK